MVLEQDRNLGYYGVEQEDQRQLTLALAHSRSQRPIGRTLFVRTEFVFAEPGAKESVSILGE